MVEIVNNLIDKHTDSQLDTDIMPVNFQDTTV